MLTLSFTISRFPYQTTEELDMTDAEIQDPYIIMSDHKTEDNPALLTSMFTGG